MLEAHDLAARRGHARLFEGLSFTVEAGHAMVVTGANGTGKTTLLRMLAGMSWLAAGEIRWDHRAVAPFDPKVRAAVAYVGHAPALKDELSAVENLTTLLELAGATASREAIDVALDAVELGSRRGLPARVLSQGQRRRIGLARLSLLVRPLWLLDEPATALDSAGVALLGKMIGEHLERGGLAVAATHAPLGLPAPRTQTMALQ